MDDDSLTAKRVGEMLAASEGNDDAASVDADEWLCDESRALARLVLELGKALGEAFALHGAVYAAGDRDEMNKIYERRREWRRDTRALLARLYPEVKP